MEERRQAYKKILKRKGMMLIVSAPPGGGKTSITREILKSDPFTTLSVSVTTRPQRPGEVDGEHYHFVSEEKFRDMVDQGEMLEYAQVYNRSMYGTLRAPVEKALEDGQDVLFDVDWQGHLKLKAMMEDDVVSVFILPPEFKELETRMHDRARDDAEEILRRMKKAENEISHYREFQYIIINDEFDRALAKVQAIVIAERLKRSRLKGIQDFVDLLKPGKIYY